MIKVASKATDQKDFVKQAVLRTKEPYKGKVVVTSKLLRDCNMEHVIWAEDEAGKTIGATMIYIHGDKPPRLFGMAVLPDYQRQKHGTALLAKAIEIAGPVLEVGVDTGMPETDWLVRWYTKMGFEPASFARFSNEITMVRAKQ